MTVEFGVFDHLDRGGREIAALYDQRLRLIEAYDAAGFRSYHLAEHHATTLGMAPSPGIFLSAVAQRTRRLRFGPMVYVLPAHEPLRLIEEVCMLDQLSGGRLELGVGRGFSPFELAYFGVGHLESRDRYRETLEVLLAGLAGDVLDYRGEHFRYVEVPMVLQPVQRPHPPLWYGLTRADGAPWAARNRVNVLMNGPNAMVRPLVERYVEAWRAAHDTVAPLPMLGLSRHVYVADTHAEAEETARRGYEVWYRANAELWRAFLTESLIFPKTFDEAVQRGTAIVGAPETVRKRIAEDLRATGSNYLVGRFAFGDIPLDRLLRSVELFANEVMPGLREPASPTDR